MSRYKPIQTIKNNKGVVYYKTVIYPEVPHHEDDIYIVTDSEERLDILAHKFFKNSSYYWLISISNPNLIDFGSIFIPAGAQIRIPFDYNKIIDEYYSLNK